MNESKRKSLRDAIQHLSRVIALVESVCDAEEDAMDNCPENLQESDRYMTMESAVDNMHEALDKLGEAEECIEAAMA